jgi:glycosyltransferase involved in cell wall biosynthesis
MRIGIDGGCLANRRGFGRFARKILQALAELDHPHHFVVILDEPSRSEVTLPDSFERIIVPVHEAPSRAASARGRRRIADMLAMGRAVSRARLDLIYFPATYSFFPVWNVPRVVVTLHDTLPLAHPELVFPTRRGRLAWKLKEHAAVRWADRVVTVSKASRGDICAWFRLDPDRVDVITEGPDDVFRPTPSGGESDAVLRRRGVEPGTRFLLYVGGLSPHKNLPRLLEAFAAIPRDGTRLVLVGDLGDVFHTHVPALRDAIARLNLTDRVHFTGFVPDAELAYLYGRAYALVQPSLLEGFGLPPVEAMACGTPVLHSRSGSLPEVVAEAGLSFDPLDVASIAGALQRLLASPAERDRLAGLALNRARAFTWRNGARSLLHCFDRAAKPRDRRCLIARRDVEWAGDRPLRTPPCERSSPAEPDSSARTSASASSPKGTRSSASTTS